MSADLRATERFEILDLLSAKCGQTLTPDLAEQLAAEIGAGLTRARAALAATPAPVADDESLTLVYARAVASFIDESGSAIDEATLRMAQAHALRAVLARYGGTAPAPVPVPVAGDNVRYEFSVFNSEHEWQAGGDAETLEQAQQEGGHYLAQYAQDGPHYLELREVRVLPAHALPLPGVTP